MSASGLNLLVFRDGRRRVRGAALVRALLAQLESWSGSCLPSHVALRALLRAGELECGAADSAHGASNSFSELTDDLALALLGGAAQRDIQDLRDAIARAPLPESLNTSAPEGFAYYALHPLAYAEALDRLLPLPAKMIVVGIRSIGTTLSAVTAAAARLRGSDVKRLTVRPGGHPYDRRTEFSPDDLPVIQSGIHGRAHFLVVDEGPGLSGSSFLSVAEALEAVGVEQAKIVLLPSHAPNHDALCSANAAQRWRRYQCLPAAGKARVPGGARAFVGAGEWRRRFFPSQSVWPPAWTSMERLKYISHEGGEAARLFKFAGLGHYGEGVLEREQGLAAAGFGAPVREETDGFVSYPWLAGCPMAAGDLSPRMLTRLAEYCAFRTEAFAISGADVGPLQEMAEHNLRQLGLDLPVALRLERPVIADGRMQPHEWILTPDGNFIKTDGAGHGEDHFYPGPTDVAWDLAGAIVEWRMNSDQAAQFLHAYQRKSGDDARARIEGFLRAYAAFRCAYCRMAANAMAGTPEQDRLDRAAERCLTWLAAEAAGHGPVAPGLPARHASAL
jgi:hypothetical protein